MHYNVQQSYLLMNVGILIIVVTGMTVSTIGIVSVVSTVMVTIAATVFATGKRIIIYFDLPGILCLFHHKIW